MKTIFQTMIVASFATAINAAPVSSGNGTGSSPVEGSVFFRQPSTLLLPGIPKLSDSWMAEYPASNIMQFVPKAHATGVDQCSTQTDDELLGYKLLIAKADPKIDPGFVVKAETNLDPKFVVKPKPLYQRQANQALVRTPTTITSSPGQESRQP